ncbi:porin [Vibrio cincinnatiensis]|uniref:porin n=1 Tax=Vibrio cincinnatiensis TaxID=675 RepID=UPI001EDDCA5F|nr:porin [Vibrio cincinnatiensis]MCG3726449.1 porin [Vibrio cincinnatiensis]MCG3731836.1 porin [Vibrio cincinnatiensis]MCG3739532.1 porin [Vibrio cincinnatiensis]MCG3742095.1 porin [Vibrio cincinnatiensis]MCG3747814.1 porin [Vibrio cincinnatiensis]
MDKMFKRTLLGAAVAMAAVGSSANAAVELNGKAVQFYGQAAGFVTISSPDKGDDKVSATIESRVGFRGVVEFEDFGPDLLWQIEGGNADHGGFDPDTPWTHNDNGQLGARDTYLGLGFDGVGSIKYGRQLVAAYDYVDWPHSNPGLGNVFDWNNDIDAGYQDRADNVIRFDSETFGGFNYQVTLSGMEETVDGLIINVAGSYQAGPVNLHAGMYHQDTYENKTKGGLKYYLVGATAGFDNFTLTGALKFMENDLNDGEQMAYSVTGQYINNSWVYKLGVSGTNDAKLDGNKQADTKDLAVNARLGYLLPSTYLFMDLRNYKMNNADGFDNNLLIGAEYYF